MDIIQGWEGYGANLFEVEQTSNKAWPKELWLAISLQGVGVFPRGEFVFPSFLWPGWFIGAVQAQAIGILSLRDSAELRRARGQQVQDHGRQRRLHVV